MRHTLYLLLPLLVLLAACNNDDALPSVADDRSFENDTQLIQRADRARMYGTDTTRVTVDEYVDYACPDCADFHVERMDSLRTQFVDTGQFNFVVRFYPIPRLMRGFHAAEAALCAGAFGGRAAFEGMQDRLLREQDQWRQLHNPQAQFVSYADDLNLPIDVFLDCLDRSATAPLILGDLQLAAQAQVEGTPTFVYNVPGPYAGVVSFYGNQPMARFQEALMVAWGALEEDSDQETVTETDALQQGTPSSSL